LCFLTVITLPWRRARCPLVWRRAHTWASRLRAARQRPRTPPLAGRPRGHHDQGHLHREQQRQGAACQVLRAHERGAAGGARARDLLAAQQAQRRGLQLPRGREVRRSARRARDKRACARVRARAARGKGREWRADVGSARRARAARVQAARSACVWRRHSGGGAAAARRSGGAAQRRQLRRRSGGGGAAVAAPPRRLRVSACTTTSCVAALSAAFGSCCAETAQHGARALPTPRRYGGCMNAPAAAAAVRAATATPGPRCRAATLRRCLLHTRPPSPLPRRRLLHPCAPLFSAASRPLARTRA
jgi:hypothetical protein